MQTKNLVQAATLQADSLLSFEGDRTELNTSVWAYNIQLMELTALQQS